MIRLLAPLALLAAPALAQAPQPVTRQIKIDVSPAGQAVLKKYLGAQDPFIVQKIQQLRANQQASVALADAPTLNLVRLEALMREKEALQTAVQRRGDDRTLQMLKELPEADRTKFLRSLRNAQPAAKPAPNR